MYEGSRISIKCFSTEPALWYYNGQILAGNYRRKISNMVVWIHDTISNDTGLYFCKGIKPNSYTNLTFCAEASLLVGGTLNYMLKANFRFDFKCISRADNQNNCYDKSMTFLA